MHAVPWQWNYRYMGPVQRVLAAAWHAAPNLLGALVLIGAGFLVGMRLADGAESALAGSELRESVRKAEMSLRARVGELELARLEVARLSRILDNSERYRIPADLAAEIYDAALSEGIDPALAYGLVHAESRFARHAISPKGAVGLTQVMPMTASLLEPQLEYDDLFERETNLRLGFRYLRMMLERYGGNLELALLAYNRGPGTVDSIRGRGGNPDNGYAETVLRHRQ